MLRKLWRSLVIYIICTTLIIFIVGGVPIYAVEKNTTKKFTGSYLTNFHIYQLGTYEFVMKLYGKNLSVSEPDFFDNTMQVIINNARVKNISAMNLLADNLANSVPLISDLNIENLSDDLVSIIVRANMPMKFESGYQNFDGFTLRIKTLEEQKKLMGDFSLPPVKKSVLAPKNYLPFRVNQRITVELRDAELQDVVRMLMAQIGKNVIIDPSFPRSGRVTTTSTRTTSQSETTTSSVTENNVVVTMSLNDVRIDEIMDYFMRNYNLYCYPATQNALVFGSKNNLYKLSGERKIKTFNISYAEVADVAAMLKSLASLQDNEITTDTRMRTLFVNTNPAKMEEVENLLEKIDVPAQQVMIRASIFEFNDEATRAVENALEIVYDEWTQLDISPRGGIAYTYNDLLRGKSTGISRTITGVLTALEERNKGKILANPSVIAMDGQQASIKLTQDYIYTSGKDEAGNLERETEEVGPQLTFTPRIERNGYVRLKLEIKTGDVLGFSSSGNTENVPITSDRNVTTEVRVRNGMPFVVGGLFQDTHHRNVSKIPVLGDIPLLGELFKYRYNEHSKTQVVMVITPYIIESR